MSTSATTIDFLLEQLSLLKTIRARKMFGEYALYCDEKVVALVCDDELYLKPTDAGAAILMHPVKKPPYPGAKPYYWISGELWDDAEMLCDLVQKTAAQLPLPKPKKPKKPRAKNN